MFSRAVLGSLLHHSHGLQPKWAPGGALLIRDYASNHAGPSFRAQDLEIQLTDQPQKQPAPETLEFGKTFSDHMLVVEHTDETGWGKPRIQPFGNLSVHPAAQVLHYGMCCFEGMKAYHGADGRGRLFRPDMNMARFQRSCQRLMLAEYDPQELLACLKALLRVDRAWLPTQRGYSMYIRPFAYACSHNLGVHMTSRTTLSIILSPVGPYFKSGLKAISLYIDDGNVRAWPGGVGQFKIGGNYAPTIVPQVQAARDHGCSQVIYTLPAGADPEDAVLSECGSMNVFLVLAGPGGLELVTPPLDGTILPGVTRDSILRLATGWGGLKVSERAVTLRELSAAAASGRLREVFGAGTACVVQPVERLVRSGGQVINVPVNASDPTSVSGRLLAALTQLHYAEVASDWSVPFE